jgi:glycosyltransferase involved in cell wall biosynthesis
LRLLVLAHANRSGGAWSVALDLLNALAARNEEIEVIGVLPVGCGYEQIAERLSPSTIWFDQRGSICRRFLFDVIVLPRRLRSIRPDAVLALGNIGMRNPGVPQLILLQDSHFVYPHRYYGNMPILEHARYLVQRLQVARCLRTASTVYCQTPTMLERARQVFRIQGQMKLLPKSVALRVSRGLANAVVPAELAPFADCFRLICLTRYYPHKNIEAIVHVFRRFREELRRVVVFLTISPTQGPGAKRLLASIERHHLSEQIINLGPMEQDRIPAYFQNCHAMLFPTIMESFSAAYLEAMMLGLPILTSDLDFAREVCGSAALYFDPWNPKSILSAVIRARQDVALRQRLIEFGRARQAEAYSRPWSDIAAAVADDLRKIAAGQGNPGETPNVHSSSLHR